MKKLLCFATATLFSSILMDTAHAAANMWTPTGTLAEYTTYGGGALVKGTGFSLSNTNPSNCSIVDGAQVSEAYSAEKIAEINKTLIAAFLAGRTVRLKIGGGGCTPEGRLVIVAVEMR